MLAKDGVMVTYGGMARMPASVPTGALIFKNISARGFWLSRWLADEKAAAAAEAAEAAAAAAAAGGEEGKEAGDDYCGSASNQQRTPRRIRLMTDELCGLVRDGKLRMPAREVRLEDVVTALTSPPKVGGRKLLIRFFPGGGGEEE